jgi:hypothetical protein
MQVLITTRTETILQQTMALYNNKQTAKQLCSILPGSMSKTIANHVSNMASSADQPFRCFKRQPNCCATLLHNATHSPVKLP